MRSAGSFESVSTARTTAAPNWVADAALKVPRKPPIGVRRAAVMKISSVMTEVLI
jgi:hypothetical protein